MATEVEVVYEGGLTTQCLHKDSGGVFKTDAPKDVPGGQGRFFSPTDLVGTALGSCALTLMGMAATKLKIDLKGSKVTVKKEMSASPPRRIQRITLEFFIPLDYPEDTKQALIKAAKSCPVHESLHPDISQEFTFHFGSS